MQTAWIENARYLAVGIGFGIAARMLYRRWTAYEFEGKTVLITGGSRGLGLNIARQLVGEGARLVICARDPEELLRAEAELVARGGTVKSIHCDIKQRDQVQVMVEEVQQEWGPVDVVINNAGIIQAAPAAEMTQTDYEEALQTHFYGPFFVIEALLPQMKKRRRGRIVNISSIGGRISVPHLLPYSTSKFALTGYSLGLRSELAQNGITVTTICPGLMRTGSVRNARFKGQHRAEHLWFKISSSLPVASMNVERAAEQVIDACRHGDAFRVLGLPTQMAEKLNSLCPGAMADILGWANQLLPQPGGIGQEQRFGSESETRLSESWLTGLTQQAAHQNNEIE